MRKGTLPGFLEPETFGVTLHHSVSAKYLRVIPASRLTWREHVEIRMKKARNSLWAYRRSFGATWDLKPKVVHWLYISIIRPSITFLSLIWWPGCKTASAKRRLSKIQRLAYLGIKRAMHTTPTGAMETVTCLGGSRHGKVSCALALESGVLVLPPPHSRT
jgi:hypothetical protein